MLISTVLLFVILTVVLGTGSLLGWMLARHQTHKKLQSLQNELEGVRVNFNHAREAEYQLRSELDQTVASKETLARALKKDYGHDDFLRLRKQLESARQHIQNLIAEVNKRDQLCFDLKDEIQVLQKHLRARISPTPGNVVRLPLVETTADDLEQVEGIDKELAYKLRAMGIINYRQLAESTPAQLANIQRLIGEEKALPLRQWVRSANRLFQKKYQKFQAIPSASPMTQSKAL